MNFLRQQTRLSKTILLFPLCLLILLFLRYPLLLLYPFPGASHTGDFYTIDLNIISALALFGILIRLVDSRIYVRFKKRLFVPVIIFIVGCILQFFLFKNYSFREFSFSISWLIIPLAVYLYADSFNRLLMPFLTCFWIFNAIYALKYLFAGSEMIGISANRNWHAALILALTPLFFDYLYEIFKERARLDKRAILIVLLPVTFLTGFILYKCYSRGANLALVTTSILFLFLWIFQYRPLHYKKIAGYLTLVLILVPLAGVLIYGDKIAYQIHHDIRLPLWDGALKLFLNHPWIGVGTPSYESHYIFNIPIERFLRCWYYTERSDHPHNHLLYIAGGYGLLGLLPILYLWLTPVIHSIKNFKKLNFRYKLIFFSFMILSIHAMFDLIIFKWPTIYIFFIFQGLLWRQCFYKKGNQKEDKTPSTTYNIPTWAKDFIYITAGVVFILAAGMLYHNTRGSLYSRAALIYHECNNLSQSLYFFDKAVSENNTPRSTYDAGILSLLNFNDYRLALKYFRMLQAYPDTTPVHSNSHIANCLIHLNREKEALHYQEKETQIYPISVIAHYNLMLLQKNLGLITEANMTANKLMYILKLKQLTPKNIPAILNNPKLDGHFDELNQHSDRSSK